MRISSFITITLLICIALSSGARDRRESGTDSDVILLKRVVPAFPLDAFAACTQGYAVVEFTIDAHGGVTDATVIESEPPGVFDAAATGAVSQWQFTPRIRNGVAVPERVSQQIDFAISSDCQVDAELPADLVAVEGFDEKAARDECLERGGAEFGFATLSFRVDENGRPADVIAERSTSAHFAYRAREQLAEKAFDAKYEALTFTHTFAFCLTGE